MKTAILVALAAAASACVALGFALDKDWVLLLAFVLLAPFAVLRWKFSRPWWIASTAYGFMGIAQLIAKFWLRAHGDDSKPVFDVFGPGFLAMAILVLMLDMRNRRSSGHGSA